MVWRRASVLRKICQYICIDILPAFRYTLNVRKESKELQLQIRISPTQKLAIQTAARKARMGMSEWILSQIFSSPREKFQDMLKTLKSEPKKSYLLAEIHDLLQSVTTSEFEDMVAEPARVSLEPYWGNYIAAMIEHAGAKRGVPAPSWVSDVKSLDRPVFGTDLENLRLYLLTHSPVSFRKRNIFIDSTIGERV